MAAPLIVRLIQDATQYLKSTESATASITAFGDANLAAGEKVQISSRTQVQASLRATEALKGQIAGYRELAASATESAEVRERAALLANRAEARLNVSTGVAASLAGTSKAAQTGERDLGKFTRGALAGSGAASSLGRSLAFASTGFIAVAGTSTIIASSIKAAVSLAKTQRQVEAQLKTTGKSWDQYGARITEADLKESHLSGFTNQELLQGFGFLVRVNGNVSESLKLTGEAADVARGRGISLASAAIALAKAQGGSVTALRRLGIVIPKGVEGLKALAFVQEKFAGQAAAGATVGDKFKAVLVDTEETIGNALLPTFTRLTTGITDYLAKANETGRLQRDVNDIVKVGGLIFHGFADAVKAVDQVTGSLTNTLKLLFQVLVAREIIKAVSAVDGLAASWTGVATEANAAAVAQERATGAGSGAGVAGAARSGLFPSGANLAAAAIPVTLLITDTKVTQNATKELDDFLHARPASLSLSAGVKSGLEAAKRLGIVGADKITTPFAGTTPIGPLVQALTRFFGGPNGATVPLSARERRGNFTAPELPQNLQFRGAGAGGSIGPFGTATPVAVYAKYTQTITEQLAVAQAALTKTTKDDVTAAKAIIARIKNQIDKGHLEGASLIQALQDEATQQGVLDSARQSAAQQAAKVAAAKKAAASSYTTPVDLQIAEVRSQLTTATGDDIQVEKRILAAAKEALASGKKNKQGQLAALQVELQAQQALQSLGTQNATSYTLPARLQLALAKAQATGGDQTRILLQEKAALEKALKSSKGNIQKQIDIYNQISSINQQLGASATAGLSKFKQLNVKKLSDNLGLSPAARKALEARLSQIGPHGTVPGEGTGAYGFTIGRDGRPIHVHTHISIDGKKVADNTTKHQQRRRRRNSSQRRGPVAGGTG